MQEISSLPYVYNYYQWLCSIFGFAHTYFSQTNLIVVILMIIYYRYLFIEDTWELTKKIDRHCEKLIFILPLNALVPYAFIPFKGLLYGQKTTESGDDNYQLHSFCVLNGEYLNAIIFYFWAWVLMIVGAVSMTSTFVHVYKRDKEMAAKFFQGCGAYIIISILCWLPRSFDKFTGQHSEQYFYAHSLAYVTGILCFIIFLREKKSLALFERNTAGMSNMSSRESNVNADLLSISSAGGGSFPAYQDEEFNESFSWEIGHSNKNSIMFQNGALPTVTNSFWDSSSSANDRAGNNDSANPKSFEFVEDIEGISLRESNNKHTGKTLAPQPISSANQMIISALQATA